MISADVWSQILRLLCPRWHRNRALKYQNVVDINAAFVKVARFH